MKRTAVGILLVGVMLGLGLLPLDLAPQALAADDEKVGLVVKFADGSVFTGCVDYAGSGMTGEDVLDASGLPIVKDASYGLGAAICKVGDVGCDEAAHCFCQCEGATCEYWAYYHLDPQEGEWIYSGMGASWNTVQPGDVEGWAWGNGEVGGSDVEPPVMTFAELCPPATPPVVDLYAEPASIISGQCATVHWSVENAGVVTLNGEGVRPADSRYVCPQQDQTFELLVFNDSGEYSYEVTIRVTQPSPTPWATATPTRAPTATTQSSAAPPPTATRAAQTAGVSPPPSPTIVPSASPTSEPTVVAMAPTEPRAAQPEEQSPGALGTTASQPTLPAETPETPPQESVGLERILLLLGVGAGTLGFGTFAFVGMLVLLIVVYLRARTQF